MAGGGVWHQAIRLDVVQWLIEHFQLTAADARTGNNFALRWVCYHGHLVTAQWLVDRFGLTVADTQAVENEALRWACHKWGSGGTTLVRRAVQHHTRGDRRLPMI